MPGSVNRNLIVAVRGFPILPTLDFEFDRLADELDQQIEDQVSAANHQALFEGIAEEIGEGVGALYRGPGLSAGGFRRH